MPQNKNPQALPTGKTLFAGAKLEESQSHKNPYRNTDLLHTTRQLKQPLRIREHLLVLEKPRHGPLGRPRAALAREAEFPQQLSFEHVERVDIALGNVAEGF